LTLFSLAGVVTAGGLLLAQQENVPGMPTLGRVYVVNRGGPDAVGVTIQGVTAALPVAVSGTATVALAPNAIVPVRPARQAWEYRQLSGTAGQELIEVLNKAGSEGWEAVGWSGTGTDRVVLLKRPR
jgi:hypothetical protein